MKKILLVFLGLLSWAGAYSQFISREKWRKAAKPLDKMNEQFKSDPLYYILLPHIGSNTKQSKIIGVVLIILGIFFFIMPFVLME